MAETDDPLAALEAAELPIRAAAARDLALAGTPSALDALLKRATSDPSPGVRLGCAAAAADILSRSRVGKASASIPEEKRAQLLAMVASSDPSHNVGLFQVCGALGTPAGLSRILIGLRDPRADVRAGAVVGLLRYAESAAAPDTVEQTIVPLLRSDNIRPETQGELARMCAQLGYWSALDNAVRLSESAARGVSEAGSDAVARLSRPPGPDGLWVDLGVDAGEAHPAARPSAFVATVGQQVFRIAAEGAGAVKTSARPALSRQRLLRRPGSREAPVEVLQIGEATLWAQDADEQLDFGDALVRAKAYDTMRAIDPILPLTASTFRLRGVLLLETGDAAMALSALDAAVEMKRCPVDTWYFHGAALRRVGRSADARASFERYIAKAPKRAQLLGAAREALAQLPTEPAP